MCETCLHREVCSYHKKLLKFIVKLSENPFHFSCNYFVTSETKPEETNLIGFEREENDYEINQTKL